MGRTRFGQEVEGGEAREEILGLSFLLLLFLKLLKRFLFYF